MANHYHGSCRQEASTAASRAQWLQPFATWLSIRWPQPQPSNEDGRESRSILGEHHRWIVPHFVCWKSGISWGQLPPWSAHGWYFVTAPPDSMWLTAIIVLFQYTCTCNHMHMYRYCVYISTGDGHFGCLYYVPPSKSWFEVPQGLSTCSFIKSVAIAFQPNLFALLHFAVRTCRNHTVLFATATGFSSAPSLAQLTWVIPRAGSFQELIGSLIVFFRLTCLMASVGASEPMIVGICLYQPVWCALYETRYATLCHHFLSSHLGLVVGDFHCSSNTDKIV